MIANPHIVKRRLNCLYRKLISLWIIDADLTQKIYDEFMIEKNSGDKTKVKVLNKVEAAKDPLWVKYIVEEIAIEKIKKAKKNKEEIVEEVVASEVAKTKKV